MKLVINRSVFLELLSSLVQIIPSKSGEPLFLDFSIKCEKELLTLVAGD